MVISPHFESYLLQRDEKKVSDFNREHTKRQKIKRKKREHEKLRKELDRRFKDVAKNLEYSSMIGCNADEPKTITEKNDRTKNLQACIIWMHSQHNQGAAQNRKKQTLHVQWQDSRIYCTSESDLRKGDG